MPTKTHAERTLARHSPPSPEQVAFLGSADHSSEDGRHRCVHVLCWPTVPTGWNVTAQRWHSLCAERGGREFTEAQWEPADAWIVESAPQLAAPFRGTTAAESSLASLLARIPMHVAIGLAEVASARHAGEAAHRTAFSNCLTTYDDVLQAPGREPCSLLVARSRGELADRRTQETFGVCRARFAKSPWVKRAQVRHWMDKVEPIPLDWANLLAAAVVRRLTTPTVPQPLFDALVPKLVRNPFPVPLRTKRGGK